MATKKKTRKKTVKKTTTKTMSKPTMKETKKTCAIKPACMQKLTVIAFTILALQLIPGLLGWIGKTNAWWTVLILVILLLLQKNKC